MKKFLMSFAAMVMAVSVVSGCTDPETRAQLDDSAKGASAGLDKATRPDVPQKRYNPLVISDKIWNGNTSLRLHRGVPLPAKFETERGVTLVSSEPMSLGDIVKEISQQTGIPFHVSEVGSRAKRSAGAGSGAPTASTGVKAPSSEGGDDTSAAMSVTYEGSLSGLLERLAGNFGINWRFDGSTITINRFETRIFTIEALPGKQKYEEGMQDDSSSGSGGGGSSSGSSGGGSSGQNSITQNSKFSAELSYWDELEKIINNILGGTGSAVIAPTHGTVTVTTTPEVMRTVANYLEQENQRNSRQIAVNVEIYAVTLSKGLDFNLAFNTALRRMGNFSINDATAAAPTTVSGFTGGGTLSLAILNPNQGHAGEVTDVLTALSGLGDTSKVAKFPLITLNNRPVSRRVGQDVNYVASATSNTSGSGTTSTFAGTSLTPGTVHQGFSVQLTPRILDDGRILLQYSLSIVDVLSITSFNSVCGAGSASGSSSCSGSASSAGSSTIQLPTTSNRLFVQQSVLKSGSTLFLGGAEESDLQQNSQGVGDPHNYALGGGLSSGASHTMLFFAITPQVLDVPHSEQE